MKIKNKFVFLSMFFTLARHIQPMNKDTTLLIASFIHKNNPLKSNTSLDFIFLKKGNVEEQSVAALMCVNKFYNEILGNKYYVIYRKSYVKASDYAHVEHFVACKEWPCFFPLHMVFHRSNYNLLNKKINNKIVDIVLKLPGLNISAKILFSMDVEADYNYDKDWKIECEILYEQTGGHSSRIVSRIENMLKINYNDDDSDNDNDNFTFSRYTLDYLAYCFNKKPCGRDFFCYFFSRCIGKYGTFHQLIKLIKKNNKKITLHEMLLVNDIKDTIDDGVFGRYYNHKKIGKLTKKNILDYLKKYISDKPNMKKKDFKNDFLKIKQTLEYEGILNALLEGIYDYWSWPDKVHFSTPYCVKKAKRLCEKYIESSILSDQRYGGNYVLCNVRNELKESYHNIPKNIIPFLHQTITYKIDIPLHEVILDEEPAIEEQSYAKMVDRMTIIKQIQRYRFMYKWGMRFVGLLFFIGTCKLLWALS